MAGEKKNRAEAKLGVLVKKRRVKKAALSDTTVKAEREGPKQKRTRTHVQLEQIVLQRTTALRRSQEQLAAVLHTAADAIITISRVGVIESVNVATERMFGFAASEMIGQNCNMLMPTPYKEHHNGYLRDYQRTHVKKIIGIGREVIGKRKDGTTFPVDIAVSKVQGFDLYTGVLRDITQRKKNETDLNESERFLRSILDGLSTHIAIVDKQGTIIIVNRAWREFGKNNGAIATNADEGANYLTISESSIGLFSEEGPAVAAGIRDVLAGRIPEFVTEYPCHISEKERWFAMRVTPFPDTGPPRVVVAHENISKRKELEREVVEIASLEQRRIGQDLHDSVGQELTALNILAGDLVDSQQDISALSRKQIDKFVKGLQQCQRELRSVMRGLLPVAVDSEGLMAALADLALRTQQEGKSHCTFVCPHPVSLKDNLVATHIYLIVQEAVHNAVKHANPKEIKITLQMNDYLVLTVFDDGVGTPHLITEHGIGLGFRIMQNRAAIIGATLSIQSAIPHGTLVTCTLIRSSHAV